ERLLSEKPFPTPATTRPTSTILQDHRYQEALAHLRNGEYRRAGSLVDALSTTFNGDHADAEIRYLRGMLQTLETITHETDPQKRIGNDPNKKKVVKHERYDDTGRGLPLYGLFSVVDVDFMNTFAWREIARTAVMDFGRYEDALEFLDYTLLIDPTDNEAHLLCARIYRALGSPVEAAEAYAKIDMTNPKYDFVKEEANGPTDLVERCNLFWAMRETLKEKTPDTSFPTYKTAIENYLLLGTEESTNAALYLVYEFLSQNEETASSSQKATLLYYQAIGQEKKGALTDACSSLEQALAYTPSEEASQIRRRLEDVECELFAESYKKRPFKITYIMPTKNPNKEHIYQAIESILAQEGDLKDHIDLVVVDDGSTENITQEIRNRYGTATSTGQVKVIRRHKNMGQSAAETLALRIAFSGTSDYVTFLDSDDIANPNRTAKLVGFLEEHRDIDFVHARVNFIDQQGNYIPEHPTAHWFRHVAWAQQGNGHYDTTTVARLRNWECPVNKQTVMIRAATAKKAGFENVLWGYMGSDNSGQDMVYWTSVAQTGAQFGFLNDIVANYRLR
ncbi:MAG: glycosyltransferase, partial [Nanoarchaeota archaeon]